MTSHRDQPAANSKVRECWNCGHTHEYHKKELCPAYGKTCLKCQKPNHFASKCRSKTSKTRPTQRHVRAVESEDPDEVFPMDVSAVQLDNSQLVTLKLESENYLCFQADRGAQCNVVPLLLYKKATQDYKLEHLLPADTTITAYGGNTLPVVGRALVHVWRGDFRCKLDCKLIDVNIRPLLGRKVCLGMKIISYLDNK